MGDQEESVNSSSSYIGYQDPSFLQYRLDTSDVIRQIETTLSGKLTNYVADDKGNIIEKSAEVAAPKVNQEGFTAIINHVKSHINTQTVQGNLKLDHYNQIIADTREELAMDCMINIYKWGIQNNDYSYIVNVVMDVIKLFLSRLLDNKERESYSTMKETSQVSRQSKGWGVR